MALQDSGMKRQRGRPLLIERDVSHDYVRQRVALCRERKRAAVVDLTLNESELQWVMDNCAEAAVAEGWEEEEDDDDVVSIPDPVETFDCVDRLDPAVAPCAPPDVHRVNGRMVSTGKSVEAQRCAYWRQFERHRKAGTLPRRFYVPQFFHRTLLPLCRIVSVQELRKTGKVFCKFREADGDTNEIRISFSAEAADAVAKFGNTSCVGKNHVRGKGGDGGTMVAWGDHVHGKRLGNTHRVVPFANSRTETPFTAAAREAAVAVCDQIDRNLPDLAEEFRVGRAAFPPVRELLGGEKVLSEQYANSVDLYNAAHLDFERVCFVQWAEDVVGDAKNWYLLFPNVAPAGLAVELTHGVGVSWVGELHPHCTPITKISDNNHTYGFWLGVKNDMFNEYNKYGCCFVVSIVYLLCSSCWRD
jgi:hypothetical protein